MPRPSGSADLPLHGGRVPAWLSQRMSRLARVIAEAIVLEYGREELLRRLAHPFWFQSFGAVMGMDWHSSGITTATLGALRRGLAPIADEIGIFVCGGRGRHSRRTPDELRAVGDRTGLDGESLARASRLVAKVDNAAVQDHFQLYLHAFVVTAGGRWVVVQQGMDPSRGLARRYHWHSEGLRSFVEEPHSGIEGAPRDYEIVNLTDRRAAPTRELQVAMARGGPDRVLADLRRLREGDPAPHLRMPERHAVMREDIVVERIHAGLRAAADRGPEDFEELLLVPGVGPRTIYALSLIAEVIHGTPVRFADPARFSTALGGKDGHPFPVPLRVYDETLGVLRAAVQRARLGCEDRLAALRELDRQARALEGVVEGFPFERFVAGERRRSAALRGQVVRAGRRSRAQPRAQGGQLSLPGIAPAGGRRK